MLLQLVLSCLIPTAQAFNPPSLTSAPARTWETAPPSACQDAPPAPDTNSAPTGGDDDSGSKPKPSTVPLPANAKAQDEDGIRWGKLANDSMRFLAVMQGFRWATELQTRVGGAGVGQSYVNSIGNLHGWADGDPFYVNYVGHPMQGAVSGRLFLLNDGKYGRTELGDGAAYWKGRLRATAFAWAFSEQFEIGPISEA